MAELPATFEPLASFESGKTAVFDLTWDLDGTVPSTTGNPLQTGLSWVLAVTFDPPLLSPIVFAQPVIVTQPRDRLNSGAVDEPEFARQRAVEATDSATGLHAVLAVEPMPADLAAPMSVEVSISNPGSAVTAQSLRLEFCYRWKGGPFIAKGTELLWWAGQDVSGIAAGETAVQFEVPAINIACPDSDMHHGWSRGLLRLIVDRPGARDVVFQRDLALCLEKPGSGR